MDDLNEVWVDANSEDSQALLNTNKELTTKLKGLQKPWASESALSDISTNSVHGYLWKKKRAEPGYKKYYFALAGNQLYYYKNQQVIYPSPSIHLSIIIYDSISILITIPFSLPPILIV